MDIRLATLTSQSLYLLHIVLNTESMQNVILLCVNTLLATKVTLITGGI
jgi:hypothetical protein